MEQNKVNYKLRYQIFLVIGLLGVVNIATKSIVAETYNIDAGYLGLGVLYLFSFLFGVKVAAIFSTIIELVLDLSFAWLIAAYYMNRKSKVVESPTEENKKKLKIANVIAWIACGIMIAIMLSLLIAAH